MINTNNLITAKAVVKRIRMSPVKVRRVLKLVKNCSYQDALILLEFLPYKACGPVWQVLRSAVANAEYKFWLMLGPEIAKDVAKVLLTNSLSIPSIKLLF